MANRTQKEKEEMYSKSQDAENLLQEMDMEARKKHALITKKDLKRC